MSTSRTAVLRTFSWVTLALPFLAYGVCALALLFPWADSGPYTSAVLARRYAFLVSASIAACVLLTDAGFKTWREALKPLASLVLCALLYTLAARFTWVL
jgi:quinol-cytochrome oxidoreductase complex cytochrome b subunit